MTGTLASLIVAVSITSTGGLFGEPDHAGPHRHLFPPPEQGGFFFRHKLPRAWAWSEHYTAQQQATAAGLKGHILPPGPGNGWGFPNGNPDGYGWADYGYALPLGGDRNPDYYFPRYFAMLPEQMFLQSYYNPYIQRGQRYIPYTNCGGDHPFGGPPPGSATTPTNPDQNAVSRQPQVTPPAFGGRIESMPPSDTMANPNP